MSTVEMLSDYESPLILTLSRIQPTSPSILLKKHVFTLNKNSQELLNAELWTITGEGRQFPVYNPSTRMETTETWMKLEYKGDKEMIVELVF